jgi:predicted ATP-dependent endonuclease of OLD family
MRIHSIRIENFRSFRDETVVLDDYTCLVGPNGAGKSTVLCALNIFFRETENSITDVVNLSQEDFHQKKTDAPIKITVTFTDLNEKAQEDFKDYYRQGKLIVSAIAKYDAAANRAEVKQYGQRLGMADFRPFFEAASGGAKVADLKVTFEELRKNFADLPPSGTKDAMISALHDYEANRPTDCVPIDSEDQFYGVSRGNNRLIKYVQWVYVPAVKDVTAEQNEGKATALGKLLARTVRLKLKFDEVMRDLQQKTESEYQKILDGNQAQLKELETSLVEKLSVWAHPDASLKLSWQKDSKSAVQIQLPSAKTIAGEGVFEGDLARLGHGFQRSYLLAVLQVLSTIDSENLPRLILGCEEPELYQHPPQARHLASVFEQLSTDNTQIIVSTHSPAFVTGKGFEAIRMVRFDSATSQSQVKQITFENFAESFAKARGEPPRKTNGVLATLHQALQPALNEMFFTKFLVLVEGLEDIAFVTSWMILTGRWDDYRRLGVHVVPSGGKSRLAQPLIVAQGLRIPHLIMFDADGNDLDKEGNQKPEHKRDNELLLALIEDKSGQAFPADALWGDNYVVWPKNIGEAFRSEVPEDQRLRCEEKARAACGHAPSMGKNCIFIGEMLAAVLAEGTKPPCLEKLCERILAAAST